MPTKEWFDKKREEALKWAYNTCKKEFVVLDTETAALKGEIVQIGIIDHNGNILLKSRRRIADIISRTIVLFSAHLFGSVETFGDSVFQ